MISLGSSPAPVPDHSPAPAEPAGPLGVPAIAMHAYQQAADRLGAEQPGCAIPWTLVAGIGQVESQHGAGRFFANGDTVERITGPRLDGHVPGTATIKDTDGDHLVAEVRDDVVATVPLLVHPARGPLVATPHDLRVRSLGLEITSDAAGSPTVEAHSAGCAPDPAAAPTEVAAGSSAGIVIRRDRFGDAGAQQRVVSESEAREGMQQMSRTFVELGRSVYVEPDAADALATPAPQD